MAPLQPSAAPPPAAGTSFPPAGTRRQSFRPSPTGGWPWAPPLLGPCRLRRPRGGCLFDDDALCLSRPFTLPCDCCRLHVPRRIAFPPPSQCFGPSGDTRGDVTAYLLPFRHRRRFRFRCRRHRRRCRRLRRHRRRRPIRRPIRYPRGGGQWGVRASSPPTLGTAFSASYVSTTAAVAVAVGAVAVASVVVKTPPSSVVVAPLLRRQPACKRETPANAIRVAAAGPTVARALGQLPSAWPLLDGCLAGAASCFLGTHDNEREELVRSRRRERIELLSSRFKCAMLIRRQCAPCTGPHLSRGCAVPARHAPLRSRGRNQ